MVLITTYNCIVVLKTHLSKLNIEVIEELTSDARILFDRT